MLFAIRETTDHSLTTHRNCRKLHNGKIHYLVLLTREYSADEINEDEVCGACGMYGGEKKCIQSLGWETLGREITGKTQA
jgi:hypothetical protein